MAWINDTLLQLTKQLYPDGRAFQMPAEGVFERLTQALNESYADAYNGSVSILNDILPDNDGFDANDCTQWERRLGLITNTSIPLADRKLAILQKMAYPGIESNPRQAASFLETQLRNAGYDVYVYENKFATGSPVSYVTKTPFEILGITSGVAMLNMFQLGEVELAETWADDGITICVNHLEESTDEYFVIGDNWRSTFYIAGATVSTFADVDADRKETFRQMILQFKPAQTVAILFVNYI
jgi:uncharacterized protein YmfQ (DUF2313 family)